MNVNRRKRTKDADADASVDSDGDGTRFRIEHRPGRTSSWCNLPDSDANFLNYIGGRGEHGGGRECGESG